MSKKPRIPFHLLNTFGTSCSAETHLVLWGVLNIPAMTYISPTPSRSKDKACCLVGDPEACTVQILAVMRKSDNYREATRGGTEWLGKCWQQKQIFNLSTVVSILKNWLYSCFFSGYYIYVDRINSLPSSATFTSHICVRLTQQIVSLSKTQNKVAQSFSFRV